MNSTITTEQQAAIADFLRDRPIAEGLGDRDSACSIAAINLALTGELTDDIPPCMSEVIGRWIIVVQDAMPAEMRNSEEWRRLLPLAAGTGREQERERLALIHEWMWGTVLPYLQPLADSGGYGERWRAMCLRRSAESAREAADSAYSAAYSASKADSAAYSASKAAYSASKAAAKAAKAATYSAGYSAKAAKDSTGYSAKAAKDSTDSADSADSAKAATDSWKHFDPAALLARLISTEGGDDGLRRD